MDIGQNFHSELFERAPLGETKAFYRMSELIFVKNWHKIANIQSFQKSSLNFVPLYDGNIWCKFQLI